MLVGAEGFEPPAPCSQSRCSTRLSYAPNRTRRLLSWAEPIANSPPTTRPADALPVSARPRLVLLSRTARNADFVVLFEPRRGVSKLSEFTRVPVTGDSGVIVDGALGLRIVLGGKQYEVILNPDRTHVKTCRGMTRKILSVEVMR